MKIVVDVFGCDNPKQLIIGCVDAVNEKKDLNLILTGNEDIIKSELNEIGYKGSQIEIVDAKEIITNEDVPTVAIRRKKDSSLVKALDIVKSNDDVVGMLSAGSTGAVLSGAIFNVGRIKGVKRPALSPILPTVKGGDVCLVDCGANVDCKPEYLVQFALMGISYMRAVYGIENPRVGLVSVGVEDKKGNELTKEVFKKLKELPINFLGNMEARDALSGEYDVLVCDGFVGNVLMKTAEGTANMVMKLLKQGIMSSTKAKIGALFMKKVFKNLKTSMNYNLRGGAPFLGVEKIIVKGHGTSNPLATKCALFQIVKMAEANLIDGLKSELSKFSISDEAESEQE